MSKITKEEILHLAELSSLSLSEAELESISADIDHILEHILKLDELDTDGVEPTYQCSDLSNVWREDEIEEFEADRGDLLALAPATANHQIKVPKVL